MHYSFSTILMTILASNLLIILITFCFRREKLMLSIGYRLLAVFLILTLIRFLFPFELPFTKAIFLPEFLSKIIFYFQHPFFKIGFFKASAWYTFGCIWFAGCLVNLYKHIKTYRGSSRYIATFGRNVTENASVRTILSDICTGRKNSFQVIILSNLDSPQIFGIFSPRILIPEYMNSNSEEFRFALHHESYHYFHHDLLIKEAVNLLCILYWWNPACRLLQKQVGLILEMHVDASLVNGDAAVTGAYMHSLISILEAASGRREALPSNLTVDMINSKEGELTQRFQMLCHKRDKTRIPLFILLLLMVVSIYLCSYGIILEASYTAPLENDTTLFFDSAGFYAIPKLDGTYDIYYNDIFTENVDSLNYYPNVPIINHN